MANPHEAIEAERAMKEKGFEIEHQGGGCTWAIKDIMSEGHHCYIAITYKDDPSAPESLDDPVTVGHYYYDSNVEPIKLENYNTLREYLDTITA